MSVCSSSMASSPASRTECARRRNVPPTSKTLSVVTTTRVRSHFQTARSAINTPSAISAAPASEYGRGAVDTTPPTPDRTTAQKSGRASTIPWRLSLQAHLLVAIDEHARGFAAFRDVSFRTCAEHQEP